MTRVTMAVPEAHIGAANELAACLGYSEADRLTFAVAPTFEDGAGNLYRVASSVVEDAFLTDALSPLAEPAWGADMDAASAAQAMVAVHELVGEGDMRAHPDQITAIVGDDPDAARAAMGLNRVA